MGRPRSARCRPDTRGCGARTSCARPPAFSRSSEIDGAERFDPAMHMRPSNAWPLVFLCSLLDAERIADDHEVVVVVANSTGWYTALAASGALGFDDAFRLVQEMAAAAEVPLPGDSAPAELIYPLTDDAWQPAEARIEGLSVALGRGQRRNRRRGRPRPVRGDRRHVGRHRLARRTPATGTDRGSRLPPPPGQRRCVAHTAAGGGRRGGREPAGRPALGSAERDPHRRARRPVHAVVDRSERAARSSRCAGRARRPTTSPPAFGSPFENTHPTSCSCPGPAARSGRHAPRLPWPRDIGACAAGPSSRPPRLARPRSSFRCAGDRARARPARPARPAGHARATRPRTR